MLNRRLFLSGLASATASTALLPGRGAAQSASPTRVALIMTGPITDGGWAQLAYEGLQALQAKGFVTAYAENVAQANLVQAAGGYADDGYDLIIGHGYEFGSAFLEMAPDYPDQKFFASTFKPEGEAPENLRFIDLAYYDAAYGAGTLAALISEKGAAVGFVGGGDNPTQRRMMDCFIAGAQAIRAGVKGLGVITGDYDNAGRGSEAASAMIANGADVIWHGANVTGLGAIQGAVAGGAKALGCYSDQTSVAPETVGASFVMNLGWMVEQVGDSVAAGDFKGGEQWRPKVTEMWSLKAGAFGERNPALISEEAWSAFQEVWSGLGSGEIEVGKLVP